MGTLVASEYSIQDIDVGDQWMHLAVRKLDTSIEFYATVVYGHNALAARTPLWLHLQYLNQTVNKPWLIGGDFNKLLYIHEKLRGQVVQHVEVQAFYDCVTECNYKI